MTSFTHRYTIVAFLVSTHCIISQQTVSAVCEGDQLRTLSAGCMSADDCRATAESMGMQIGSEQFGFAGDWDPKGCVYYPFSNQAYFGIAGTCDQLSLAPDDGSVRVDCATGTLMDMPPVVVDESENESENNVATAFDGSECEDVLCGTVDDCRAAAEAMGLQLGSDSYQFEGDYPVKGCHYFAADTLYSNQAYFGRGASACSDFAAAPTDGSQRLEECGGSGGAGGTTPTESDVNEQDVVPPTGTPDATDATTVPTDAVTTLDNDSTITTVVATANPTATPIVATAVPTNVMMTGTPTGSPSMAPIDATDAPTGGVIATGAPSAAAVDDSESGQEIIVDDENQEDGVAITTTEAPMETPTTETEAPTEAPKDDKNADDNKNNNADKEQDDKNQGVGDLGEDDEDDEDEDDENDDEFDFIASDGTEAVFGNNTGDRSDAAISAINNGEIISAATATSVGLGASVLSAIMMVFLQ